MCLHTYVYMDNTIRHTFTSTYTGNTRLSCEKVSFTYFRVGLPSSPSEEKTLRDLQRFSVVDGSDPVVNLMFLHLVRVQFKYRLVLILFSFDIDLSLSA